MAWQTAEHVSVPTAFLRYCDRSTVGVSRKTSASPIQPWVCVRARLSVLATALLTDEEVNIFWHSLAGAPMTKTVATMLRLALVTGQRIGEIAGMTKAEVNLTVGNPIWTQAGARRKNKELTRVPLSPLAVALIIRQLG